MSDTQRELLRRAQRIFVGGTLGEFHLPDDVAVVFERGAGSKLYTVDGGEYLDYLLGSGPMILGHCHPAVVAAVSAQVQRGTTFFSLSEPTISLGERIVDAAPCGEQIRFVGTGSDAVAFAVRMARAFTGRRKVLRFEGGWHGVSDFGLHGARPPRPSDYPRVTADSAGLPPPSPTTSWSHRSTTQPWPRRSSSATAPNWPRCASSRCSAASGRGRSSCARCVSRPRRAAAS